MAGTNSSIMTRQFLKEECRKYKFDRGILGRARNFREFFYDGHVYIAGLFNENTKKHIHYVCLYLNSKLGRYIFDTL
jgi:hypothetical protein